MPTTPARVRRARPEDVEAIDSLVRELAVYEREPDAVKADPDDFRVALFGPEPRVHCHVAEVRADDGWDDDAWQVVGMALWYVTFSTWQGRHGIWLEDLFVRPAHRDQGLGRALMAELAQECTARGYSRLEWWVLDWNAPAHGFYAAMGAVPQEEWTVWRLDGDALRDAGQGQTGHRPVPPIR